MKTLVTKLNGTIDNIYLPKIGYFPIKINSAGNRNVFTIVLTGTVKNETLLYLPNNGSYVTNQAGTDNLCTEVKYTSDYYQIIYLSNNTNIAFINKYKLSAVDLNNIDTIIDLEDLRYS